MIKITACNKKVQFRIHLYASVIDALFLYMESSKKIWITKYVTSIMKKKTENITEKTHSYIYLYTYMKFEIRFQFTYLKGYWMTTIKYCMRTKILSQNGHKNKKILLNRYPEKR